MFAQEPRENPYEMLTVRLARTSLVEIRPTSSKGNGLFATCDISRGTRIISEIPFLSISEWSFRDDDRRISAFCSALQHASKAELQDLDQLHCDESYDTTEVRQGIRGWYKGKGTTDANGNILKGKKLQNFAKSTVNRYVIFLTNMINMDREGAGIFSLYSRINHSCKPSVYDSYNTTIHRLTVHAIRDISAGEEITVSYLASPNAPITMRRDAILGHYGFVCGCEVCLNVSKRYEAERAHIFYMKERIEFDTRKTHESLLKLLEGSSTGEGDHYTPETLQRAESLAELLENEGLEGKDLCEVYRYCAAWSFYTGSQALGISYAGKELEIERRILGTETEHLRTGLKGAEYFLAVLENLAEKEG
ncbi:hypothetical protein F5Y03DRAFT_409043 [Xylaria venustula]|nr:hypothetical protein F5Y03DRAFT_409043 [Xylaria venustula]